MSFTEKQHHTIQNIAEKYSTPLYIYDLKGMRNNFKHLSNCIGSGAELFYSLKANPNLTICKNLQAIGAGAEVCSLMELQTAIYLGFSRDKIIFVGPGKTEREIQYCIENRILAIVCESYAELQKISKIACYLDQQVKVILRINPNFQSKNNSLKMGGVASQFGMDEDQINLIPNFSNFKNLLIIGIHVYCGTRFLDEEQIAENTINIASLATRLQDKWQLNFEVIDVGGGFGVPYFEKEKKLDLGKLGSRLRAIIGGYQKKYPACRVIYESGRFLVAEEGVFVSKVLDVKISRDDNFIITDGGTNCHMAAVGVGTFMKRNFPISHISQHKSKNPEQKIYQITGPLCTPNDLIAKNILLNEVHPDDLILIRNSGAYGPSASPTAFLSHGYPTEVAIDGEEIQLIRKADEWQDIFRNQINLDNMKECA